MRLAVRDPEIFGVTHDSVTVAFRVEDGSGPVEAPARLRLGGECLAVSEQPAATRLVRVEGLEPGTEYEVEIDVPGAEPAEPDRYFPGRVRTLRAPVAAPCATFATLNDLHFGEPRFGGTLTPDHEYGDETPGNPLVRETDTEVPYWRIMNEDAVAEINAAGVDAVVIKGDIADRGLPEQFAWAAETFARFAMPHHAFLGNHDHYGRLVGLEVDGYALLGQPEAPRTVDLGGWRLVLLETAVPGEHHGEMGPERMRWLDGALAETRELGMPTLVLMHHQPVPPEHRDQFPNDIGLLPEHSLPFFDRLGEHPQVKGVLIGHTHRNRVRRYAASGSVPYIEVQCTKDYPGGWAHYTLFEDGSFRQEVRRIGSLRALTHSSRCRGCFQGLYRDFALGSLGARSFEAGGGV
jgi:Icc protein